MDFYKKIVFQELYALRYVPAYYFEYCALANELKARLGKISEKISIASLGCGLSPDYYAFRDNPPCDSFEYTGFDAVEWSSQKYMPPVDGNHKFVFKNIANLNFSEIADIDVFVFPKSIGDISRAAPTALQHFSDLVKNTPKKTVYFLNSYITKDRKRPMDLQLFMPIHNTLITSGFSTSDNVNDTYFKTKGTIVEHPIGLRAIDCEFVYPEGFRISCGEKDEGDTDCQHCPVPLSPIFTNAFMAYQLIEYRRQ